MIRKRRGCDEGSAGITPAPGCTFDIPRGRQSGGDLLFSHRAYAVFLLFVTPRGHHLQHVRHPSRPATSSAFVIPRAPGAGDLLSLASRFPFASCHPSRPRAGDLLFFFTLRERVSYLRPSPALRNERG